MARSPLDFSWEDTQEWRAARDVLTPPDILGELAESELVDLRWAVAANAAASTETLGYLASDESNLVRGAVAGNPSAPPGLVGWMTRDHDPWVQWSSRQRPSHQAWTSTTSRQPAPQRLGETGPGGGIVFHDAGRDMWWGRYLEVAPPGWRGDSDSVQPWGDRGGISVLHGSTDVGWGLMNTLEVVQDVPNAAAAFAAFTYRGGGLQDWHLPSLGELLLLVSSGIGAMSNRNYWSSTQVGMGGEDVDDRSVRQNTWCVCGTDAHAHYAERQSLLSSRPIRAFGVLGIGETNHPELSRALWPVQKETEGTGQGPYLPRTDS